MTKVSMSPEWCLKMAELEGESEVGAGICIYCDGTGDVHRIDGEWLGVCPNCTPLPAVEGDL